MPENAQMESVAPANFNNFMLKRWLHSIGPVRRCEVLKKLKADLENLGLSRRRVYRGLIQLATKPRVVLTWQPPHRRFGSKILLENEGENKVEDSCKTNASNPRRKNKNVRESNMTDNIVREDSGYRKKINEIKELKDVSINSIRKPFAPDKECELQNSLTKLHPFDKVLGQFDELIYSKRNVHKKSFSKRTSHTMSSRREKHVNHIEDKSIQIIQKIPDLVLGKVGTEMNIISNENKKSRIKSNLSPCCTKKVNSYVNSEIYKNVDTDYVKLHVDKKSHNCRKITDNKIHSLLEKNKHSKHKNSGTVLAGTEIIKIKGNQYKRKVRDQETLDFMQSGKICTRINNQKEINKHKRINIENKFRTYFGDFKSVSEDEQEQEILQKTFKRRRKKDSVDSCDSGVYTAKKSVTGMDILKDVQETIFNSITNEESNEGIFKRSIANTNAIRNLKEVNNDKNIQTINQVKGVKNIMKIENNESQPDTYVQSVLKEEEKISKEETISIFDRNNIKQNKNASSDTDILQILEQSDVSNSITSMQTDSIILSLDLSEICSSNQHAIVTSEDHSECPKNKLDTKDLNELLHMSFTETCKITSNGNVLSIQETTEEVINKDVEENLNFKNLSKIQSDCNENVEEISNCAEKNNINSNNILLPIIKDENYEGTITNNKSNIPNNRNELVIEERELHMSEREDDQSNNISQRKLRVLSSAELGSRWCPTPVNNIMSPVSQFSYSDTVTEVHLKNTNTVTTVTQTVPMTVSLLTVPVSTPTVGTTISENIKRSIVDSKFSESVYVTFVKIRNLIQNIRISSITNLNYDKLLFMEFEKLREILNTEDYVNLTEGVIGILNKELLVIPSLSLLELFRYTPLVKSFYIHTSNKHKIAVNNSNEHQTKVPTIVPSQIMSNQNMYCNPQASHNICVTSVHSRLQHLFSIPMNQNQTPINVTSKQLQQHVQENAVLQSQNNFVQNNMSMNSTTINNHNTQEPNYNIHMYGNTTQQDVSNTYFTKPVTNMCATQDFPIRHSSFLPTGINNHLEGRYIPVPNMSFMNQQYIPQSIFVPQTNAFYNVNEANNPIQTHINLQNVAVPPVTQQHQNTIHQQSLYNMSQGNQLQTIPQRVSPNYNMSQSAQMMFALNTSHSVSTNTQQKHKKTVARKISMKVPQKSMPEQVSSEQLQNIYPFKTKQSMFLAKKKRVAPISLESTTKLFDILKYISHIQKLILLKQLDFYFSCTAWLQQQFTSGQWQKVYSQRSLLLHLQTLLKHLVEKTLNDHLSDKFQGNTFETNVLTNIKIDVPKTLQIIVKENEGICCQLEVSKANQEQNKIVKNSKNCITCEENLNDIITKSQCDKEYETINLQNKEFSHLGQKLKIPSKEKIQKNETVEKTIPLSKDNFLVKSNSQIYQTNIDVNQKDKMRKESNCSKDIYTPNTKEQNLNGEENITENVSQILEKNVPILSDVKVSNKDISQQLNPHLVTVEVSSKNDQVIVVNTDVNGESESMSEEPKEYEEYKKQELHITNHLSSLENTSYVITTSSSNNQNNIQHFNNAELNDSLLENITSYIEDVRSISLEAFEEIGETLTDTTEENMKEEEVKVCLFCGKSSTVACSICLEAKYCSKVCSELHWVKHYKDCTPAERNICN